MVSKSTSGRGAAGILAVIAISLLTGCSAGRAGSGASLPACPSGQAVVVAAENFWGSIAAQLAGDKACVRSVVANPDTDPHAYEAKPSDAKLIASARYVIVNGAGYDPWALRLIAANPVSARLVLNVADLAGVREGGNPHLWYSPDYVGRVIDRVNADLDAIDSQDAAYFDQEATQYRTAGLKDYHDTISAIRLKYRGTPVGSTESIFAYTADALGLNLVTPREYMKAISEGTDPSAADKAAVEEQVAGRSIRALVFNTQNSTRDVVALVDKARARKIPVADVTETLTPAGATFQAWQTRQLRGLLAALGG